MKAALAVLFAALVLCSPAEAQDKSVRREKSAELLEEFGLESSQHKERGPCAVIEFLGLLLCNVEGSRCVALTEGRQQRLRAMIDEWLAREPARPGGRTVVAPRELASLLMSSAAKWSALCECRLRSWPRSASDICDAAPTLWSIAAARSVDVMPLRRWGLRCGSSSSAQSLGAA